MTSSDEQPDPTPGHPQASALPPLLLREEQAMELLQLRKTKLRELTGNGTIPTVRIGRCVRIRMKDLESFVDRLASDQGHELA